MSRAADDDGDMSPINQFRVCLATALLLFPPHSMEHFVNYEVSLLWRVSFTKAQIHVLHTFRLFLQRALLPAAPACALRQ